MASDETTANGAVISRASDLGSPTTTDPEKIGEKINAYLREGSPVVVFTTIHSSPRVAAAQKLYGVPEFDYVVVDEAHHTAGPVARDFATILNPKKIKARRRLFATATQRYFSEDIRDWEGYKYASMDDESKYGKVFHRLTYGEAVKRDLLVPIELVVIGTSDKEFHNWAHRGRFLTVDGVEVKNAHEAAGQIAVAKAMRKYDLHRVAPYFNRIEKGAQPFADSFKEVVDWIPADERPIGAGWAKHVHGDMPADKRGELIKRLAETGDDGWGLLASARTLGEGIDIPNLDAAAIMEPRRSAIDIGQIMGRVARRSPGKTKGYLLVSVFIPSAVGLIVFQRSNA